MTGKLVACVAAMCDGNRGIGYRGNLPWPSLPQDVQFYTDLCRTSRDPDKKNGIVKGRLTWECTREFQSDCVNVVVSTKMSPDTPDCLAVVTSVTEALDTLHTEDIENIFLLGGSKVYEDAILDPRCNKVFLTRVFRDFPSDTFFPPFEQVFHRVQDDAVDDKMREENGVRYRFEVWERNHIRQ